MVSASAAYYSVYGLSQLFAGASIQVMIMASSLEFAKLTTASLLYQYWDVLNRTLKLYLLSATLVLMVITSGGIYGFLSGAYQETATKSSIVDEQVAILESKRARFEEQREYLRTAIQSATNALANPTVTQRVDSRTGQVISSTSSSQRRILENELRTSKQALPAIEDSIAFYDIAILDQKNNNESARELGPLKYLAELTGTEMNKVVNWFLLLIVFVFDPLAISLVIASNMAFMHIKKSDVDILNTETLDEPPPSTIINEEIDDSNTDDVPEVTEQDNNLTAKPDDAYAADVEWLREFARRQQEKEDIYREKRLLNRNSYWANK